MRHVLIKLGVAAFAAGLFAFSGPANAVPNAPLKQLAGTVSPVEEVGYRYRRRYRYRRPYFGYFYRPHYRSYRPYYRYRRPYYGYRYYRRPYRRYYGGRW